MSDQSDIRLEVQGGRHTHTADQVNLIHHESSMLELFGYYVNPDIPFEDFQDICREIRDVEVAYFKKEIFTHSGGE